MANPMGPCDRCGRMVTSGSMGCDCLPERGDESESHVAMVLKDLDATLAILATTREERDAATERAVALAEKLDAAMDLSASRYDRAQAAEAERDSTQAKLDEVEAELDRLARRMRVVELVESHGLHFNYDEDRGWAWWGGHDGHVAAALLPLCVRCLNHERFDHKGILDAAADALEANPATRAGMEGK